MLLPYVPKPLCIGSLHLHVLTLSKLLIVIELTGTNMEAGFLFLTTVCLNNLASGTQERNGEFAKVKAEGRGYMLMGQEAQA